MLHLLHIGYTHKKAVRKRVHLQEVFREHPTCREAETVLICGNVRAVRDGWNALGRWLLSSAPRSQGLRLRQVPPVIADRYVHVPAEAVFVRKQ